MDGVRSLKSFLGFFAFSLLVVPRAGFFFGMRFFLFPFLFIPLVFFTALTFLTCGWCSCFSWRKSDSALSSTAAVGVTCSVFASDLGMAFTGMRNRFLRYWWRKPRPTWVFLFALFDWTDLLNADYNIPASLIYGNFDITVKTGALPKMLHWPLR